MDSYKFHRKSENILSTSSDWSWQNRRFVNTWYDKFSSNASKTMSREKCFVHWKWEQHFSLPRIIYYSCSALPTPGSFLRKFKFRFFSQYLWITSSGVGVKAIVAKCTLQEINMESKENLPLFPLNMSSHSFGNSGFNY